MFFKKPDDIIFKMLKSIKDKYLIDIRKYEIIKELNRGGCGIIYIIRDKITQEKYVAKVNSLKTSEKHKQFVKREVGILLRVHHPTIIHFYGVSLTDFNDEKNITIIMEYLPKGSLLNLIEKEQKSLCPAGYDNTKRQILLAGIARSMMILHNKNIIHRDLSSGNILLDENFHPKITDFGLSKFFDPIHSKSQTLSGSGTIFYMAPEVIESYKYNTSADVYSFGIIMYEILTGKRAYSELLGKQNFSPYQFQNKVIKGLRPNLNVPIKKELKELIQQCWSPNPNDRPNFAQLFLKLSLSQSDNLLKNAENIQIETLLSEENYEHYCLDNVDIDEFLEYIEDITNETDTLDDMQKIIDNQFKEIQSMKCMIESQKTQIEALMKNNLMLTRKMDSMITNIGHIFYTTPNLTDPGILCRLKMEQKTPFNPPFIASQSMNDIYNLINPNTEDFFTTNLKDLNTYIEFKLKQPIKIIGFKIFNYVARFPKSFDILVDGKLVYRTKEARALNGVKNEMSIQFSEVEGSSVRFIQTGRSWDKGKILSFKRFEILSSDEIYSNGVFTTLMEQYKDPHKCNVYITSSYFSNDSFYRIDTSDNIFIGQLNGWFQVELLHGLAILNGFRIKFRKLKSFKLIATDDVNKPNESWLELYNYTDDINRIGDSILFFEFNCLSPPVRFIRLIQTGANLENKNRFTFTHFDVFGYYY